ncbi:MAG: CotH kinase family protein [Bacteroidales bacterium]|nr:CotH kinase family protein [Bacteroidales bacterium]
MNHFRIILISLAFLLCNSKSIPAQSDTLYVQFSHAAGFYSSSFTLTLTSPDATANILYTLDGSHPPTSPTAIVAGNQATITVDPSGTSGRPKTPAFIVRASLKWAAYTQPYSVTYTYIFADQVKTQAYPGGGWPNTTVNDQIIDLEMDPDVVTDGRYTDYIDDALLNIPSISVVTDLANLFNDTLGIYVNAASRGDEWERFSSVELINPDGSPGFRINAGLRIRGGWNEHTGYRKHAFRLFFRSEYGAAKLDYPLFGDEGVRQFDKIDLSCEQDFAWANTGGEHHTMVREVFSRDTQRDMGQPYTRSRYYHLYLNGMYWGIYQTQEQSEARFAADYMGDSRSDYDVITVETDDDSYTIETADGFLDKWQQIYNLCTTGFADNANYFRLEGKDAYGQFVKGSEVLVDIDNLIDYMLTIFYTGNFDAPVTAFRNNNDPNDFYAVNNRSDKSKGFVFFNSDAEHSLMVDPISPGTGLNENRVDIAMIMAGFSKFHPQWLHYKLSSNAEYRAHFADRVLLHMTGNGILTPSQSLERLNKRVTEIETAIIAESARWGDATVTTPYTKDDTWLTEINTIQTGFFPYRTDILLDQMKQSGLYPALDPPRVSHSGTEITELQYDMGSSGSITIQNPNTEGNVYYTTNGSDPREIGGTVSSRAVRLDGDQTLAINAPMVFKARVYNGSSWSALHRINFYSTHNDFTSLKITELHYHPRDVIIGTDTISGKNYEFIEFKNTGTSTIDLTGLVLDSATYYEFPAGYLLPPQYFFVIATKPSYFYWKYGRPPSGNCQKAFSNAGEYVLLRNAQHDKIIFFYYDDEIPFPESADGDGYTLTASEANPTLGLENYRYWMASTVIDGSPFADDPSLVGIETVSSMAAGTLRICPNPSSRYLFIIANGEAISDSYKLNIVSLTGSVVYECSFTGGITLDLPGILPSNGVYFLNIAGEKVIQTEKLIYTPR